MKQQSPTCRAVHKPLCPLHSANSAHEPVDGESFKLTAVDRQDRILFEVVKKVSDGEEQDWPQRGANVAHALAHPARLGILELLRDEGAYVMHLCSVARKRTSHSPGPS